MRDPFVRPFFARFFYVLAAIGGILGAFILLIVLFGAYQVLGNKLGTLIVIYGVMMIISFEASALSLAAIGYVIDLLAKIEWNTRPGEQASGGYGASAPGAVVSDKQYYFIDKGPMNGPLSAPAMLDLYREGKVSNSARLYVEEYGQRRLLKNWSEVGL